MRLTGLRARLGALLALFVVLGVIQVGAFLVLGDAAKEQGTIVSLVTLERSRIQAIAKNALRLQQAEDAAARAELRDRRDEFERTLDALLRGGTAYLATAPVEIHPVEAAVAGSLREVEVAWPAIRSDVDVILGASGGDPALAEPALRVASRASALLGPLERADAAAEAGLARAIDRLGLAGLVGSLVIVVVVGVAWLWVDRSVVRPLERLSAATRRIAAGDLDVELAPTTRRDEVGQLTNAFTEMTTSIRRSLDDLAEAARLLDASASEIFVIDPETLRIRRMNARARWNLGYEDVPAGQLSVAEIEAPEAGERSFRAHLAALAADDRRELECDLLLRRRDGTVYPAEGRLRLATEERPPVVVAVVHDVTERRRLDAQLEHAQRVESIGRLAGGIAHDFNNFLTVIAGHAQLLLADLEADDPRRVDVEAIATAANQAAGLTSQLLAFGRRQVLQPQTISLNDVVRETEPLLRRLIGEHIALEIVLAADLGATRADPGQIQQILMNLAVNARDAMPGGGRLTIETANVELDERYVAEHVDARPGPHVVLAVSDTGHGMDAEVMAHLFEPFFTTKERGRGTGLGLATSYGIARQSGGHITAYSEPGRGSTFKLYLPRTDAPPPAAREAAPEPALARGGGETILVVEDEAAVRDLLVAVLSRAGYTVLAAPDPAVALDLVAGHAGPLDLVISDLVLPGMDGLTLVGRLRSQLPTLPVLFISGYSEALVAAAGAEPEGAGPEAGAPAGIGVGGIAGAHFVGKPFTPRAILAAVRQILDAQRGGEAARGG